MILFGCREWLLFLIAKGGQFDGNPPRKMIGPGIGIGIGLRWNRRAVASNPNNNTIIHIVAGTPLAVVAVIAIVVDSKLGWSTKLFERF